MCIYVCMYVCKCMLCMYRYTSICKDILVGWIDMDMLPYHDFGDGAWPREAGRPSRHSEFKLYILLYSVHYTYGYVVPYHNLGDTRDLKRWEGDCDHLWVSKR